MDATTRFLISCEIDSLFMGFYVDNIKRFRKMYTVLGVDGSPVPYDEMLPVHTREFMEGAESQK